MTLTEKEIKTLEIIENYTGTKCAESLYNHIETILNDVYVGHLSILNEDFGLTKKEIASLQNKI